MLVNTGAVVLGEMLSTMSERQLRLEGPLLLGCSKPAEENKKRKERLKGVQGGYIVANFVNTIDAMDRYVGVYLRGLFHTRHYIIQG